MMKKISSLLAWSGMVAFFLLLSMIVVPSIAEAGVCSQNAYKQCVSNIVYWYDSCGAIQAVAQNCNQTNQICQNGMCVNSTVTPPTGGTGGQACTQDAKLCPDGSYVGRTGPNCTFAACPGTTGGSTVGGSMGGTGGTGSGSGTAHYRTQCYNNNIYWYSSQGIRNDIYKNCSDNNSCTADTCSNGACKNTLKCDGTTCAANSQDYIKYCSANPGQNPGTDPNNPGTPQTSGSIIAVAAFGKKKADPMQWEKLVQADANDELEFLITVKNTSPNTLNGVTVIANITNNINYTGNLKIDNVTSAGNISAGIDVGSLPPNSSKAVTFSGTMQSATGQPLQITTMASTPGMSDTDFFTINTAADPNTNGTTNTGNGLVNFIKKWYLWGIIILVLIILFVIIFRRLSTNV